MPVERLWTIKWPAELRVLVGLGFVERHLSDPVGAWQTCRRTPAGDALLATVDAEVERAIDDAMAIGEVIGEAREQKRVKPPEAGTTLCGYCERPLAPAGARRRKQAIK